LVWLIINLAKFLLQRISNGTEERVRLDVQLRLGGRINISSPG